MRSFGFPFVEGILRKGCMFILCLVSAMTTVYIRETHIHSSLNFIQAGRPFPLLTLLHSWLFLMLWRQKPEVFRAEGVLEDVINELRIPAQSSSVVPPLTASNAFPNASRTLLSSLSLPAT